MKKIAVNGLILLAFLTAVFYTNQVSGQNAESVADVPVPATTDVAIESTKKPFLQINKSEPPQSLEELATDQVETVKELASLIIEFFVKYSFQVLGGIIVLVLGWFIGGFIARRLLTFFEAKKFDITVSRFMAQCVKLMVVVFAGIV
ncbi:MAG: hypothetical protein K8I00_10815, partial [Candidatus Omnitrophica bacterium]|nr:hypothetical protein [Candidatus Omnitrophota bacterium]